ncbi:hypothetical protein Patl1_04449 [Pistacia atlantica]|uniref:Uncharacterized protein n=1 Tax=Pistacia atlantica TaxID=434234 RepID=A0ACC1BTA6_9ROSI|nr:hypothetical protein Patl1_04449 [Pistacia atlantica]
MTAATSCMPEYLPTLALIVSFALHEMEDELYVAQEKRHV